MHRKIIKEIIKSTHDINYFIIDNKYECFYYKSMCDQKYLEKNITPKLEENSKANNNLDKLNISSLIKLSLSEIEKYLFSGYLIVLYKQEIIGINISNIPSRSPETSPSELTITGSKDGFVESIDTNIMLLRKRVKDSSLQTKTFEIGNKIPTKVMLTYIDFAIDEKTVERITNKLSSINVDVLYNAGHLQSLINDEKISLFPPVNYTSRADFCYESLLTGRFAIFIENIPVALVAPVNFSFLTGFNYANNDHFLVALFDRTIQYISLFIGVFFLGFVTALLTYHTEFLPYLFLADFISARKGVSVSIVTELFLADLFFQIFRIAGTKSLSGINQALLIMGSIIISQIAVSSGIITQEIVLFSALTTISPFLISNNVAFNNSLNILKIFIFICSALFGFLGFCISSVLVIIYLSNLESFNMPFGNIFQVFSLSKFKQNFLSKAFNKKENTINKKEKE